MRSVALTISDPDKDRQIDRHLALMTDVVAAYVSNNSLPLNDLPALMRSVHTSLTDLAAGHVPAPVEEPQAPAVPIKKSITSEFLICLEDGKKFRSLKRHLGTVYKLTPEKYREKWGLPSDYPMVAPAYSAVRSQLAKAIGLGSAGRAEAEPARGEAPTDAASAEPAPSPSTRNGGSMPKAIAKMAIGERAKTRGRPKG